MHKVNRAWLHGTVKPHFEKLGYKLLREDLLFIEECLCYIPPERHRFIMRDYLSVWSATLKEKENGLSTGLNARYEANVYLRNAAGVLGDAN